MSWARMLLLGNLGQQLDIDDVEADVARLRARLHSQATTDQSQDQAILTMRREITELKVLVAELARVLSAGGQLPPQTLERMVHALEAPARHAE